MPPRLPKIFEFARSPLFLKHIGVRRCTVRQSRLRFWGLLLIPRPCEVALIVVGARPSFYSRSHRQLKVARHVARHPL
jgi:hypothetical protein